jgi:hypothetical protein
MNQAMVTDDKNLFVERAKLRLSVIWKSEARSKSMCMSTMEYCTTRSSDSQIAGNRSKPYPVIETDEVPEKAHNEWHHQSSNLRSLL